MRFLKELFARYSWQTWWLTAFFFLVPWQTHYLFTSTMIGAIASPFGDASLYVTEVFLWVGVLASLMRKQDRPEFASSSKKPLLFAALVFVAATLSLMVSTKLALSAAMLFHLASALAVFVMLLSKRVEWRPVLAGFGFGLIVPALLGVWQVIANGSPASTIFGLAARDANNLGDAVILKNGVRELRAYGSFSHPNIFAGYLAVGVLCLRTLLIRIQQGNYRRILLACMLVLTVLLVFTGSRSAMLGLLLGIGLVAFVTYYKNTVRARVLVVPIALVVIGSALFLTFMMPNLLASIRGGGALEDNSVSERVAQYVDYPTVMTRGVGELLVGSGLGTYTTYLSEAAPGRDGWSYQPIHSIPLLVLSEIGLLGLIAVLLWASSIDKINFARFPNYDALMAFAMGNVVLVILFFDHYIWSSYSGLILIALVMALTVRMGEK
jgi:hypothetical protein